MTKSLMISIQPKYLVNVLNGYKTLELRKTVPKDFKGWVYIYCTKGKPYLGKNHDGNIGLYNIPAFGHYNKGGDLNGKVVARFWFDEYEEITLDDNLEICTNEISHEELLKQSCVYYNYLNNYFMNENGDVFGYAWHIKKLEIFDTPKELSHFYKYDKKWSKHYKTWWKTGCYDELNKFRLKKAPQRIVWVYTKELEREEE